MEDQIRIVHVVNAERVLRQFLYGQLRYFSCQGMKVAISGPAGKGLTDFAREEGVQPLPISIVRMMGPLHDARTVAKLYNAFCQFRPHIVHAHTLKAGAVAMLAAVLARVPIRIFHVRGLAFESGNNSRPLLRLATRATCSLASQVLCISRSLEAEVVRTNLCPAFKVKTLANGSGNGLDAETLFNPALMSSETRNKVRGMLGIPHEALVVGFLGRIVREKGIVELMAAWQTIRQQFPHAHLVLVGPLENTDPLPASTLSQIKSDSRVHSAGEHTDPRPMLTAMDVLALPSYREGLGMAAIEAAAMELPVIATRISGCTDAVADGVTGTLVPPKDETSLAEAIASYLARPALRKTHGTAGRRRVLTHFEQTRVWEATYAEYCRLLELRGITPRVRYSLPKTHAA